MRLIGSPGPPPAPPPSLRRRWQRGLRRWRRPLAAALLALASGAAVHAVATARTPTVGERVVVAARDLPSGRTLARGDLTVEALPAAAVPAGALGARTAAGSVLSGPVRRGEVITDARLEGPGALAGLRAGLLAVPVAVDTRPPAGLVRVGDRVALLAGAASDDAIGADAVDAAASSPDPTSTGSADTPATSAEAAGTGSTTGGPPAADDPVVVRARVVALPSRAASGSGLLGGSSTSGSAEVVVLALDADQAARVAVVAGRRPLTLALAPGR